jgi:hypothetical protein
MVFKISKDLSPKKMDKRYLARLLDNKKMIMVLAENSQFQLDRFKKSLIMS